MLLMSAVLEKSMLKYGVSWVAGPDQTDVVNVLKQ